MAALLDDQDPAQAKQLKERFARRWLKLVEFREQPSIQDVAPCIALWVEQSSSSSQSLRATNHYTGSSHWLHDWNGDGSSAERFMDEVAEAAALDVRMEPHNRRRRTLSWEMDRPPTLAELRAMDAPAQSSRRAN